VVEHKDVEPTSIRDVKELGSPRKKKRVRQSVPTKDLGPVIMLIDVATNHSAALTLP
jgi:hypothetical protein